MIAKTLACLALTLGAIAFVAVVPAPSTVSAAQGSAPRFSFGNGAQGSGYQRTAQASRPQTVGPGARNWATGNRVPLHRPWMRARN